MPLLFSEAPHNPVHDCVTRTPLLFDLFVPVVLVAVANLMPKPRDVADFFQLSEEKAAIYEKAYFTLGGIACLALWALQLVYTIQASSELNIENNHSATDICLALNKAMLIGSPLMLMGLGLAIAKCRARNNNAEGAPLVEDDHRYHRLTIA